MVGVAVGVVGGRRMTEDGNVEITGRDLREAAQGASKRASLADIVAG